MFEEKYSVFDKGYLDVPKSSTFEFREKAFFRLNKPGALAISLGDELSLVDKNVFRREGFWQLIISSIREEHGERHSVQNTLSNSVSVFSLGANPVKVAIEGLMLMDGTTDHLAQFFELYVKMLRAKRLKEDGRVLEFHLTQEQVREIESRFPGLTILEPPKAVVKCVCLDRSRFLSGAVLLSKMEGGKASCRMQFGGETV